MKSTFRGVVASWRETLQRQNGKEHSTTCRWMSSAAIISTPLNTGIPFLNGMRMMLECHHHQLRFYSMDCWVADTLVVSYAGADSSRQRHSAGGEMSNTE